MVGIDSPQARFRLKMLNFAIESSQHPDYPAQHGTNTFTDVFADSLTLDPKWRLIGGGNRTLVPVAFFNEVFYGICAYPLVGRILQRHKLANFTVAK